MGLKRQTRIITLLVIDVVFFFVEVITGYLVGSLALVADSFHMLNDVLSLVVALYTIKLATSPSSNNNSYGWQRAEILGALINGVFLVALCMSIALEALGRFISPPEIKKPMVIVIVGSLGLLSNIVGLFLFHEHGHSHGDHGHSHGDEEVPPAASSAVEAPTGVIQLPLRRERSNSMSSLYQHPAQTRAQVIEAAHDIGMDRDDPSASGFKGPMSPPSHHRAGSQSRRSMHGSRSRPRPPRLNSQSSVPPNSGADEIRAPVHTHTHDRHPNQVVRSEQSSSNVTAVQSDATDGSPSKSDDHDHDHDHSHPHPSHLAKDANQAEQGNVGKHSHDHNHSNGHDHGKGGHEHDHGGGGGHSHGSMNMRGVFLHVMGDALGNIGVITAGLVIWFAHGRWTLYFDPGVSLVISGIILSSAIPLVRSASYILLQGVPSHVSLDALREAIREIPGVVSVHELHVWQLSETTVVASVHVLIGSGEDYMTVAGAIRETMHSNGIHSVTIQPEFYDDDDDDLSEHACLIRCPPDECGQAVTCCPPPTGRLIDVDESDEHDHHDHAH